MHGSLPFEGGVETAVWGEQVAVEVLVGSDTCNGVGNVVHDAFHDWEGVEGPTVSDVSGEDNGF